MHLESFGENEESAHTHAEQALALRPDARDCVIDTIASTSPAFDDPARDCVGSRFIYNLY